MGIAALLYFMLPAYAANILPPLLRNWKLLDAPLDFGKKLWSRPVLGSHKTWRGLVFGTAAGTITFFLQQTFTETGARIALIDYASAPLLTGFLLSFGALLGDAVKSFIKRQMGIRPGKPWFFFDQIDYVIGALALSSPLFTLHTTDMIMILGVSFVLTITIKHIGYAIGVNKVAW